MTAAAGARASASADTDSLTSAPEAESAVLAPAPDGAVTACDLAVAELERLAAAWHRYEPGARLGEDPEELHQLRVTARRVDATLALFRRQLPSDLLALRKTAKSVRRLLGAARDLDVQIEELANYCADLGERERAAAHPLHLRLEQERSQARARMVRALDSAPVRRWIEALATAAQHRGAGSEDLAVAVMPERVRRRFRKLRKSVGRLGRKSSMDDYHEVRRRAKQLRYATECGIELLGKPAEESLKALRRLQDRLGVQQDAYMAQSRLARLAADPAGLPPETLFLMGRLAERHAHLTADARRTLERSWRKIRGKRWKAMRARLDELSRIAAGPLAGEPGAEEFLPPEVVVAAPPALRPLNH